MSTYETVNDQTRETISGVRSVSYEYMKVLDKIDGKLFTNNVPFFKHSKIPVSNIPYLVNDKNEVIKFVSIENSGIIPYADGWLIPLDNIDEYEIGEYYYIMELEE